MKLVLSRSRRRMPGFTLIELIIVIAIIGILAGVAVPIYKLHVIHAHEAALKQDLRTMRDAIDQYVQDKGKAPQALDDLVSAGYMRVIPNDPFTHQNNTWQVVQEDTLQAIDQTQPGISDVHSGSSLTSSEGTAYSSW
ncbi:MAG TPA: prepilin-type N-terminal cleavage/methylation domain-containing protein [Candidatus Limnocylindrales bacterium]|jgi:general secretion pathway protein G|nr:prepilin-type N-terminal cleavage/methylation domain-containing protein [Candidatus Limnocylindrales bacterium]